MAVYFSIISLAVSNSAGCCYFPLCTCIAIVHLKRGSLLSTPAPTPLRNDTHGNDFESRRHTRCRLKTDSNKDIIGNGESRTKHQDLRGSRTAFQLSPRHRAHGRILRSGRVGDVVKVQELHRLSVIRSGDEPVLIHDQVPRGVEGQDDGLGAGGPVEADYRTVSVVELGIGSVQ